MAMASRPAGNGKIEIEAADDLILPAVEVTGASFTGLLVGSAGGPVAVGAVLVEFYGVSPQRGLRPQPNKESRKRGKQEEK